jgi:hypothetical protein
MTRCACSVDPYAGVAARPPSLHTPGSHSDGCTTAGPLTIAQR